MYRSRTSAYRSRLGGIRGDRRNLRRWQIAGVAAVAVAARRRRPRCGLRRRDHVPTVNCPAVAGSLPAVPAQAQAEIERNLALLNTQIAEANKRLATSVGQGGPNFIQNAILGPLKDKRVATINRMATAIGRNAAKPNLNMDALATCTAQQRGAASASEPTRWRARPRARTVQRGRGLR